MTVVRLKGLKRYRHPTTGIWYTYHRATGTRIQPPHEFGSPGFFAALAAAESKVRPAVCKTPTFGDLVLSYRGSGSFISLRSRTRKDYERVLQWLAGLRNMPVRDIDSAFLVELREKTAREHGWHFANYSLAVVSVLFSHGIEKKLVPLNPARGVKRVKRPLDRAPANRAWTKTEKEAFLSKSPPHLLLPIAIARWTGLRKGDIVRLPRTAYADGELNLVTSKRGVPLWFRCPRPLRKIIEEHSAKVGMRLCANASGRPWTIDGFSCSFRKFRDGLFAQDLVGSGLTFHGLRTSFAEEASDLGFNSVAISHALAQRDARSAEHYTRNSDRRRSVRALSKALERTGRKQDLST